MKKICCVIYGKCRKHKTPKYHTFSKKHCFYLSSAISVRMKMKNYLKKENQSRY